MGNFFIRKGVCSLGSTWIIKRFSTSFGNRANCARKQLGSRVNFFHFFIFSTGKKSRNRVKFYFTLFFSVFVFFCYLFSILSLGYRIRSLHCIGSLFSLPGLVPLLGSLAWFPVPLSILVSLCWCPVFVPVLVPCFRHCSGSLSWFLDLVPCFRSLP